MTIRPYSWTEHINPAPQGPVLSISSNPLFSKRRCASPAASSSTSPASSPRCCAWGPHHPSSAWHWTTSDTASTRSARTQPYRCAMPVPFPNSVSAHCHAWINGWYSAPPPQPWNPKLQLSSAQSLPATFATSTCQTWGPTPCHRLTHAHLAPHVVHEFRSTAPLSWLHSQMSRIPQTFDTSFTSRLCSAPNWQKLFCPLGLKRAQSNPGNHPSGWFNLDPAHNPSDSASAHTLTHTFQSRIHGLFFSFIF